ncbi:ArsR family transcriptional regulator [Halalkaliarchaeum desulfuricum]|uniref:ArsR family transcriptional regulator n=1 Tax=Halalkaliarchaeum desulfuricum TaxID=2055893 RepID=A0A343TP05_9EURY|nr:helix-turn-helix domain-containing protein [Halalkaliarchaeum desulfuricum]AUX10827.1 ArsR family transcriptional regulator [Halalkaliarchaeum desulfuricum]
MAEDSNSPDAGVGDPLDPAAVFSSLGNETRLSIVSALHEEAPDTPVQFSALYDRIDLDDSAQFNYHLKKLVPHFVTKTGDGYDLTAAGRRLARAVAAGTYTESPTVEPFDVDGACYACGESRLRGEYAEERFLIDCDACGESILRVHVPPTVVRNRSPTELLDAFEQWSIAQIEQAIDGICPECGGTVDPRVQTEIDDRIPFDAVAEYGCTVCGRRAVMSFGSIAYRHPDVQGFHRRREASFSDRRLWEIGQYVGGEGVTVRSRDPWLVQVTFLADGDACHVEIDGDLEVKRVEIVSDGAPAPEEESD